MAGSESKETHIPSLSGVVTRWVDLHTYYQNLKSLQRSLSWVWLHLPPIGSQHLTLLGFVFQMVPIMGTTGRKLTFEGQGEGEEPRIIQVQLAQGSNGSHSLLITRHFKGTLIKRAFAFLLNIHCLRK